MPGAAGGLELPDRFADGATGEARLTSLAAGISSRAARGDKPRDPRSRLATRFEHLIIPELGNRFQHSFHPEQVAAPWRRSRTRPAPGAEALVVALEARGPPAEPVDARGRGPPRRASAGRSSIPRGSPFSRPDRGASPPPSASPASRARRCHSILVFLKDPSAAPRRRLPRRPRAWQSAPPRDSATYDLEIAASDRRHRPAHAPGVRPRSSLTAARTCAFRVEKHSTNLGEYLEKLDMTGKAPDAMPMLDARAPSGPATARRSRRTAARRTEGGGSLARRGSTASPGSPDARALPRGRGRARRHLPRRRDRD